jgi:hypothetical protein
VKKPLENIPFGIWKVREDNFMMRISFEGREYIELIQDVEDNRLG